MSYYKTIIAVNIVLLVITVVYHCVKYCSYKSNIKSKDLEIKNLKFQLKIFEDTFSLAMINDEHEVSKTPLTERQREVLILMLQGFSNMEIASTLFIATSTVKYHLKNIYRIYEVRGKQQLCHKITLKNYTPTDNKQR